MPKYEAVKLDSEAVAQQWNVLEFALTESFLPDRAHDEINILRVKQAIEAGVLDAWIIYKDDEVLVIVITEMLIPRFMEERRLLIYCFYAFEHMTLEDWKYFRDVGFRYCRHQRCTYVLFYTQNEGLLSVAKRYAKVDDRWRFAKVEVPK